MDMPNREGPAAQRGMLSKQRVPERLTKALICNSARIIGRFGRLLCGSFDLQTAETRISPQRIIYPIINPEVIKKLFESSSCN